MSGGFLNIPNDGSPLYARIAVDKYHSVRAWSHEHIVLQPRKNNLRKAFRKKMQEAIRALDTRENPSSILNATYCSKGRRRSDVENLLFYNLNTGTFDKCVRAGIRFQLLDWKAEPAEFPDAEHAYVYTLDGDDAAPPAGVSPGASHAPSGFCLRATFEDVRCLKDWSSVWYAIKKDDRLTAPPASLIGVGAFGINAMLRHPENQDPSKPAGMLKGILDGIAVALHAHCETASSKPDLQTIIERLHARIMKRCRISVGKDCIRRFLLDTEKQILGVIPLVTLTKNGVSCRPYDHLCAEGKLMFMSGSTHQWELEVEIQPTGRVA